MSTFQSATFVAKKTAQSLSAAQQCGLPAKTFNKLLVVHKISRLTRLQRQGMLMTPYAEKYFKNTLMKTHTAHHGVVSCFVDLARRMGKDVTVIPEDQLNVTDRSVIDGVDLVVSMGGDHTFLKAQALLWDQSIPIMGVNTHRTTFEGALNTQFIDFGAKEEHSDRVLVQIDDPSSVSYEKRSRILFERQAINSHNIVKRILCLNETLTAEKDVSSASRYHITKDGKDVGLFKSSGLLISTGTGSTGWLYSVRQITSQQLEAIQDFIGATQEGPNATQVNAQLAKKLSEETVFARDDDRMYYCVREGFHMTQGESEGFCTDLKVTSEMLNGEAIVDGWFSADLSLGDTFTLKADPAYALQVLNLRD